MQIILLEKISNVGDLGDVVKVKNGYARNFLIPQGKAKRATAENLKLIEAKRAELEAAAKSAGAAASGGALGFVSLPFTPSNCHSFQSRCITDGCSPKRNSVQHSE